MFGLKKKKDAVRALPPKEAELKSKVQNEIRDVRLRLANLQAAVDIRERKFE